MAMVTGKCPRCGNVVQLEGGSKEGFCMHCGSKIMVMQAVNLYEQAQKIAEKKAEAEPKSVSGLVGSLAEAQASLSRGHYELAAKLFNEVLVKEPVDVQARWGYILAQTRNLAPAVLRDPEDFALSDASKLFAPGAFIYDKSWNESYWEAYEASCRLTVESVDPRVFLELEIYKWYPHSNTFLYPISKDFDIQPIMDKELWANWNKMIEPLTPDKRKQIEEMGRSVCNRIREYFLSGFSNMAELRNGDLSRLMGIWKLKLTTGAIKTDVLKFSQNAAGVPHLECYRTSVNGYDYYRYIKVDQTNRIAAGEHRHFPSATGLGGDFYSLGGGDGIIGLMAVYEYILIMPTALYTRAEPQKIPGHGRAVSYIEKCRVMPCFFRSENLKNTYQMRPISENHETADPSKKMRSCYVATAVYGDAEAPEVCRLRRFRDESLNQSRFGRRLCALYYRFSPGLAGRMSPRGPFSRTVRRALDAFVRRLGD
jgi:DNA-directed RNA polymerase subunit RPC12/RpoP